jgi:hypothetical protein
MAGRPLPEVVYEANPPGRVTVKVPFPDGKLALVDVQYDAAMDTYGVMISGELFDQSPEAITVAVQLAFRAIADGRALGRSAARAVAS